MSDLDETARRAAKGDAKAFRALVVATHPRLYRLALRMTADADDARDVVQDGFIAAHKALLAGAFHHESRVETWLYRIVLNGAQNHRRGRARRHRLVPPARETGVSPEIHADVAKVIQLVQELPPDQRAALVLKDLEGHTSAEIAALVGCSEGAVEQRLVRARETLRRRLTDG